MSHQRSAWSHAHLLPLSSYHRIAAEQEAGRLRWNAKQEENQRLLQAEAKKARIQAMLQERCRLLTVIAKRAADAAADLDRCDPHETERIHQNEVAIARFQKQCAAGLRDLPDSLAAKVASRVREIAPFLSAIKRDRGGGGGGGSGTK